MKKNISREQAFNKIESFYKAYYDSLLSEGRVNCRDTGIGFWGCADPHCLFSFFDDIGLSRFDSFLDLGSGDGVAVLIASLFTSAKGVEYDRELYDKSNEAKKTLSSRAEFLNADFLDIDISGHDVIFMNPDKSFTPDLERKLFAEMDGILVVYNDLFRPRMLDQGKRFWYDQMPLTIWYNKENARSVAVMAQVTPQE